MIQKWISALLFFIMKILFPIHEIIEDTHEEGKGEDDEEIEDEIRQADFVFEHE